MQANDEEDGCAVRLDFAYTLRPTYRRPSFIQPVSQSFIHHCRTDWMDGVVCSLMGVERKDRDRFLRRK